MRLARSTKGIVRLSSAEITLITIPEEIKDILVGILLGDAHIVKRSSTSNSRLVYAQTAVTHKEYFNYLVFLNLFVLMIIHLNLEFLETIELKKHIVLYLLQLCNFPVLMYLKIYFIHQI
jgi:hypothetical protein